MSSRSQPRSSGPTALLAAIAALLISAILASTASAGFMPDPKLGDVQLGKRDGIAYVKDSETTVSPGISLASAGCPGKGDAWRIAGGGFAAALPNTLINMSRPLDHADADHAADDYWEVESNSAQAGSKLTSYSICMKESKLRYTSAIASDDPTGDRSLSVRCPGRTEPISGGGSIGSTGGFLSSLYADGSRWNVIAHDADDGTGNFTADAVCLKSKRVEIVRASRIVDPVTQANVKVLCEAPAMPLGSVYQWHHGEVIGRPVLDLPIDGKDKNSIPDDGWKVGLFNPSSEPERVRVTSTCFDPVIRPRP